MVSLNSEKDAVMPFFTRDALHIEDFPWKIKCGESEHPTTSPVIRLRIRAKTKHQEKSASKKKLWGNNKGGKILLEKIIYMKTPEREESYLLKNFDIVHHDNFDTYSKLIMFT